MQRINISLSDTLKSISNEKSFALFNMIAISPGTAGIMEKLNFTRRQYYPRMSSLTKAGLIERRNRKYYLTSFGKNVYEALVLIGKARDNLWKLRAIDSFESSDRGMAAEELTKIIER
jgi:Mn-dependent DtxR family transcriptional regulator